MRVGITDAIMVSDIVGNGVRLVALRSGHYPQQERDCLHLIESSDFEVRKSQSPRLFEQVSRSEATSLLLCLESDI